MKFIIVGAGSIGSKHAKNIVQQDNQAEIIVVRHGPEKNPYMSNLKETLRQVTEVYSLEQGLDQKPDAALICNPTALHVQTALDIIPRCGNILLEKPVSHSMDKVPELVKLVAKHKANVLVAYCLRWHPVVMRVKEILGKGTLGKITEAKAICSSYLPSWRDQVDYRNLYSAKQDLGGGVILDMSHEIDYILWYFGKPIKVAASGGKLSKLEIETEDTADLTLSHPKGITSRIHLDYTTPQAERTITIKGSKGSLKGDLLKGIIAITIDGKTTKERTQESQHLKLEMAHFVEIIKSKGKKKPAITLQEGIDVLDVCLQAKKQLRK